MLNFYLKETIYLPKQIKKFNEKIVIILGRSNVGKSSFINSIAKNKKIARISKTAGKTVSINMYWCNEKFYLVDFPGYGYAKLSHKQRNDLKTLCESFLESQKITKALVLIDSRIGLLKNDFQIIDYLCSLFISFVIIITKIDKLKSNNQRIYILKQIKDQLSSNNYSIDDGDIIMHSSFKKIGIKKTIQKISNF